MKATEKLQNININDMLVIDNMPALHFGDIIKVKQSGIDLLMQVDQAADQEIKNDAMCAELNMAGKNLNEGRKTIEKIRMATKRPHLDANKEIDEKFGVALSHFDRVINKLKSGVLKYNQAKQRKLQAERDEVDRKNREAAEAARKEEERRIKISKAQGGTGENVKPVEAEIIATPRRQLDLSGTTTVKKFKAVVTDPTKVPARFLKTPGVIEAIRKEVQKEVQENKNRLGKMASVKDFTQIPGIEIKRDDSVRLG